MAKSPTADEVAELESAYDDATKALAKKRNDPATRAAWEKARDTLVVARQSHRQAEEAAGRRAGPGTVEGRLG